MKSQTPFPVVPYPIATRSYNLRRILIALGLRSLKSREMRIVSLIDEEDVIERILRHLGLWQEGGCVHSGTDPPGETTLDPWLDDPFPDYDTEPVVAFSAT